MQIPDPLLDSLEGVKGYDRPAFEKIHASGKQVTSIRLNPAKPLKQFPHAYLSSIRSTAIPWTRYGHYLSERPSFTFDPLFHAGCYYVQEASSMFLEQAIVQTTDLAKPLRVLDLCAAPGGKSTHLQSLLSKNSLLVSNEVIRTRVNILKDNIIKWGSSNVVVTHNDPRDFAKLEDYFDIIVVDAPCSGSGLFRREPEAMEEWSLDNVALCSQRQQRILADAWPALKSGGLLVYSTCSYSKEEDEAIADWVMNTLSTDTQQLEVEQEWNIVEVQGGSGAYGYRFWPDKLAGEGFFIACFRKTDGGDTPVLKSKSRPTPVNKKDIPLLQKWLAKDDHYFLQREQTVYAWPQELEQDYNWLLNNLRVIYSGTIIGELMRDKLVPDHALAMSGILSGTVERTSLNYDEAIAYLQRKDFKPQTASKGWQLVVFDEHPLGWINALPNRINNYYPKELRILKEKPE
ncbi:MAG TPA: RsmF rRNA methyltransferase first C-terminal domain-containing protein [Chitinophagaceae bacterium]|nr:RsmF rRNA methyltransferase first C-terminal domain-containing protein [Chitinophagaceae bacterium]